MISRGSTFKGALCEGVEKNTFCTLVKKFVIMDDPRLHG